MANRFSQYVPNPYVHLPIDYYQSSLMINDQRAAESLDKVNQIVNSYASIQPISPDAQALYDETINKIKSQVQEVAGKDLNTPGAQKAINTILNSPEIVGNLSKVYQDALYATEAKKNLNEYLKKNPAVNATDHLLAFNALGKETGDATKFNPNRFKNMPALVDYYDLNKTVADEVSKLKANEEEVKRIMGPKYVEYKNAGVLEDRIRDLAVSRVISDPQAKAQFNRNVRYGYYLQNPYDIEAGIQSAAGQYRQGIYARREQISQYTDKLNTMLADKKLSPDKRLAVQKELALTQRMGRSYGPELDNMSDEQLGDKMALDAFAHSFDAYSNTQTKYSEEYTPAYIQSLRDASAWSRMSYKLKWQSKLLQDAINVKPLTSPDQRQQDPISTDNWNKYLHDKAPELDNVLLDKNGAFTVDNYKNQLTKVNGKEYMPTDIKVTDFNAPVPDDYVLGETKSDPEGTGYNYYVKKGANPVSKDNYQALYKQGIESLKTYLKKITPSGDLSRYGNLDTPEGIKTAVQDVVGFNQEFEASYSTKYQLPASNTQSFRSSVADIVPNVTVKQGGSLVGSKTKTKLIEFLRNSDSQNKGTNAMVDFQIYDRDFDGPVYSVTMDGKEYKIPMHQEYQQLLSPMTNVVKSIIGGKSGVMSYGEDLVINGLDNGQRVNAVFSGGNTPQYQSQARAMFDSNVSELEKIGFTHDEAVKKLRTSAASMADYMKGGDAFPVTNEKTGKTAYIKNAVGFYTNPSAKGRTTPRYYSFSAIKDQQGHPFEIRSLGDLMYQNMSDFGSTKNPYMNLPMLDLLKNKNLMGILGGSDETDNYNPEF